MKRTGIITACTLFAALSAWGADLAPSPGSTPGSISVSGSVTEEFSPDSAILNLAVETQRGTAQEAARENAVKSEQVVSAMKGLITASAGDTVNTSSYSVQPTYDYDDKLRKNRLTGYRTFNQVTVKTSRIGGVGELIDRALKSGANNVTDVRFAIRDNRKPCEGLLVKAAQRAKSDAETVAAALGVRVDGIRHVSPSCGGDQRPVPVYRAKAMMAMEGGEPATPIEAGVLALTGHVQVEFTLEK
jgi:uncharacterized protein